MKNKDRIKDSLSRLEEISKWFETREEIDVEEGLVKVREGAALIKQLRERIKEVENEFTVIKKELADEEDDENKDLEEEEEN